MKTEDRRSFVRKSLATSMTFTFSGLIRAAHGETTSNTSNTTLDPWGDQTTTDQWSDGGSTDTLGINIEISTDYDIFSDVYTIDQWSAWSIDPVTDPPTDEHTLIIDCGSLTPPIGHLWNGPLAPLNPPIYNESLGKWFYAKQLCSRCSSGWMYV